LRRPRLADRWTFLFGDSEFIAPDVPFKTTKAEASKNTDVIQYGVPAGGERRAYLLI